MTVTSGLAVTSDYDSYERLWQLQSVMAITSGYGSYNRLRQLGVVMAVRSGYGSYGDAKDDTTNRFG